MWCVLDNPTSLLLQREQIFLFTLKTTKKDLTEHSRYKSFQRGRQGHNIIGCQMRKHFLVFTLNLLPKTITAFVFNSAVKNPSPVTPSIPFKMFHLCLISLTITAFPKGKVPVCSVFSTKQPLQGSGHPSCPPLCLSQQMNHVIDFIAPSTSLYFGVYWCCVWVFISSKSHALVNSVTLSRARSFGWITTGYKSTAQLSGSWLARS